MQRPTGVTVIALISAFFGVIGLLFGLMGMAGGALFGAASAAAGVGEAAGAGGMLLVTGLLALVVGVLEIVFAWGCWTGKGWAWILGMVNAVMAIISAVLGGIGAGFIVTLAINGLIVYYLMTPPVKGYFGRA